MALEERWRRYSLPLSPSPPLSLYMEPDRALSPSPSSLSFPHSFSLPRRTAVAGAHRSRAPPSAPRLTRAAPRTPAEPLPCSLHRTCPPARRVLPAHKLMLKVEESCFVFWPS
jgi:hypothetical protein